MAVVRTGDGQSSLSLTVWRRAMELNVAVYSFTATLPREELYGLSSQLRRVAVSIISNIAEGHGRKLPAVGHYVPPEASEAVAGIVEDVLKVTG